MPLRIRRARNNTQTKRLLTTKNTPHPQHSRDPGESKRWMQELDKNHHRCLLRNGCPWSSSGWVKGDFNPTWTLTSREGSSGLLPPLFFNCFLASKVNRSRHSDIVHRAKLVRIHNFTDAELSAHVANLLSRGSKLVTDQGVYGPQCLCTSLRKLHRGGVLRDFYGDDMPLPMYNLSVLRDWMPTQGPTLQLFLRLDMDMASTYVSKWPVCNLGYHDFQALRWLKQRSNANRQSSR